ncbi:MAG: hypothetical protein ACI8XB_001608, partial [Patiriisocius sp.]
RYMTSVKDPFKKLVEDLIFELGKIDSSVGKLEAKNAIFRINRTFVLRKTKHHTKLK